MIADITRSDVTEAERFDEQLFCDTSNEPPAPPFFFGGDPFGRDLADLVRLVAARKLDPQRVGDLPWDQMPAALERLRNRDIAGKICLTIDG